MVLRAFSVYDVKSDTYSAPFFKGTVGLALRDFADLVSDKSTTPGRHPEDFKLVELGSFDDSNGQLTSHDVPVGLGFGTDFCEAFRRASQGGEVSYA